MHHAKSLPYRGPHSKYTPQASKSKDKIYLRQIAKFRFFYST